MNTSDQEKLLGMPLSELASKLLVLKLSDERLEDWLQAWSRWEGNVAAADTVTQSLREEIVRRKKGERE